MPNILVGRDAEQPAAPLEAGGELEVGEIGVAVAAHEPVLLLGEVVVADACAMQPVQRLLGGTEVGDVAMRLCQMQRDAVDEAAHQRAAAGPQQLGSDLQALGQRQCPALARKQVSRWNERPPRHLIEPPQHRVDLAVLAAKAAALDGRKHVALEQHAFGPARRQHRGVVFRQTHENSRRRRDAQMLADPAVEVGQRPGADRLFLRDRLFVAAQPRAVGLFGRRAERAAGTGRN